MTAGLYFLKYASFLTYEVMSASWPFWPRVRASVNGTVKTVGRVPAASFAAKVGPVHWYSTDFTLTFGWARSNCATWFANSAFAAFVLPGISEATLIVTDFCAFPSAAAPNRALVDTATRLATATAVAVTVRLDLIVSPFRVRM